MSIVLISGSPSAESRSTALLRHAAALLDKSGIVTEAIVVRDLPAEDLVHGRYDSAAIKRAALLIERAHALIIATPIYKAAASGVLKAFLDLLPQNAFDGKAVLPIGVGGSPAHLLALDYSLKPVLGALGGQHLLPTLYATDKQIVREEDGSVRLDEDVALRLNDQIRKLIHFYAGANTRGLAALRVLKRENGGALNAAA